jgi:hypothetical protein
MKCDARAVIAALALVLASCSGSGLDSGMGGMGGDMAPPVSQPGSMAGGNTGGLTGGVNGQGQMAGPNVGPGGQEQLTNPGATLAPNEAQFPIAQGPTGMKCPAVQQFNQQYECNLAFNMPGASPSPGGSPNASSSAKPTASPSPTPQPSASSDSDDSDDSSDDAASPSPTPMGTMTLQMEPLPRDVPAMTNPNPIFMHVTPLVAIRLQSNMDFQLNGPASVQYTLPTIQFAGRVFGLQLYNETYLRGKRTDTLIANYGKWTAPANTNSTVQFTFSVPKVTVRHTQIWLLAMYGAQVPPGSTPTPSPTPSPSGSSAPSASPAAASP